MSCSALLATTVSQGLNQSGRYRLIAISNQHYLYFVTYCQATANITIVYVMVAYGRVSMVRLGGGGVGMGSV